MVSDEDKLHVPSPDTLNGMIRKMELNCKFQQGDLSNLNSLGLLGLLDIEIFKFSYLLGCQVTVTLFSLSDSCFLKVEVLKFHPLFKKSSKIYSSHS